MLYFEFTELVEVDKLRLQWFSPHISTGSMSYVGCLVLGFFIYLK